MSFHLWLYCPQTSPPLAPCLPPLWPLPPTLILLTVPPLTPNPPSNSPPPRYYQILSWNNRYNCPHNYMFWHPHQTRVPGQAVFCEPVLSLQQHQPTLTPFFNKTLHPPLNQYKILLLHFFAWPSLFISDLVLPDFKAKYFCSALKEPQEIPLD